MAIEYRISLLLIGIALILTTALSGCGGGGDAGGDTVNPYANQKYEPSREFLEILHGLEKAASLGERGHAVRQARSL